MKKLIAVILSLALCCLLIPAVAEDGSLAGTWYIKSANKDGTDIQVVDPEAITVTVNEDGTFLMSAGGASVSGTWVAADSVITMTAGEDNATEFTIDGDELIWDMNGTLVSLSKTPGKKSEGPAAVTAESADAFDGTWIPKAQLMYGLYAELPEEQAAMLAVMKIEAGKISSLYSNGEGGFIDMGTYGASLTDGKLTFEDSSMIPFKGVLTLLEDGRLLYETIMTSDDGQSITMGYIYVREAAAEEPAA